MLKNLQHRKSADSTPNMTPLVDVVMVILIFLMLAGSLAHPQFLLAKAPAMGTGRQIPNAQSLVLDVMVMPAANGGMIVQAGKINTQDADVLSRELAATLHSYQMAGTDLEKIQVVIHPGRDVKYENVIKIYEAVLKAGYRTVAFSKSRDSFSRG